MHSFFAEHKNIGTENIILEGSVYNHIRNVLRLKAGTEIMISSGDNMNYLCSIADFSENEIICKIISSNETINELPVKISVFQGLPKGDKMELVIQKAVELGAFSIIPVAMERSVVRLDAKKTKAKCERWNTIALNAAQQSKRTFLPEVEEVMTFNEAIKKAEEEFDHIILPYECAEGYSYTRKILTGIPKASKVAIVIGPEGGFDQKEIDLSIKAGARIITLGRRILRTETAALMLLSIFNYIFEE